MTRGRRRFFVALGCLLTTPAAAYTAAGDREFPATILLPQIGPADELYLTGTTQPAVGGRSSVLSATYDKTIIERLGIGVTEAWQVNQMTGQKALEGWQDVTLIVQYTAIVDREDERLVSFGFERQFGGTGAVRIGGGPVGITNPLVYFGQGLGGVAADWAKPFSIVGNFGYALGDTNVEPDLWTGGLAIEYSVPYFTSKVDAGVPDWLRNWTPMVEIAASTPARAAPGAATSILVAPGVTISGAGWELGFEAPIAASRGAGQGVGVALQLHLALDYLFPGTLGVPLIGRH